MAATECSAEEIAAQLTADRDPTAIYLQGDEENGPGKMFQIRENNCSLKGLIISFS